MVTSHVSCPALNSTLSCDDVETSHSNSSITHDCDLCSQCSNNNSVIDEKCSHCPSHEHSSMTTDSSTSSIDHYHHHHEKYQCSDHSSWREDLKSTSTCSSNMIYHTNKKEKTYNKKRARNNKLDFIHNNAILDDTITTRSLTSSKDYNNKKQKTRCCFCCFRSNTTSRMIVFFIFSLCVLGAIAAFFCWPRTPRVSMGGGADSVNGLPPDWWAGERSPIPTQEDNVALPARPSLRGTWQINVTLDNRDNWIPTHIRSLDFVMMDSLTLVKFAWASTSNMILQPGTISPVSLTFNVNYQAPNNMDPTFQNLYSACGPLKKSVDQRPALNVLLKVYFHIWGINWTPIVTATPYTGGILCPIK